MTQIVNDSNNSQQDKIDVLKTSLPLILDCTDLSKESESSDAGACPKCGGTDRFVYKTDSGKCWCRQCHEKPMDVIDFHCWLYDKSLKDLFSEYLPEQRSAIEQDPQESTPTQYQNPKMQKLWNFIQKNNTNQSPVEKLCNRRKIGKETENSLFKAGKLRFKNHAEKESVAIPFSTLQGNVLAIQCITSDGSDYPFTVKNGKPANKVFIKGSKSAEPCFFQCGEPVESTTMLIIAESAINAMTAHECFPEACCIALGSSGSTKKVTALKPHMDSIKKVIVCVDHDEPSKKMLRAIWEILGNKVYSFKWESDDPKGYDINDALRAGQKKRIIDLIQNAKSVHYKQENISTTVSTPNNKKWEFAKERFPKTPFPWDVLPSILKDSFKQLARSCAASPTHLPGIAFGILAAILGRHIEVSIKSSWSEPLIFWILALLPSGEGKTPAQNALSVPIYKKQEQLDKEHIKALEQWKTFSLEDQNQTPKPKPLGGIFTSDMTIEGLMRDQRLCGGVLISNDEASSFFEGQNQYKKGGKGTDRESWLKLYDGNPARIVRASGSVSLKGARASIIGGTQPSVFYRIFKNADKGEIFLSDGTLFRFIMTWEGEKFFPMTLESWDEHNQGIWENLIQNAFEFCREQTEISLDGEEEIKTHKLCFSEDTLQIFLDWANDIIGIKPLLPEQVRGFVPKLRGWVARLTGIIKCLESFLGGTTIPQILVPEDLRKGIQLAEFYMAHNIDVMQAIVVGSAHQSKESYTDQEIHLARTLQEQKINIDSGRLAVGFIWKKFNENCLPELKLKTQKAMGGLMRSCNLTLSLGKHDANGKRAVICLEWDKNTDSFIKTCLQSLQKIDEQDIQDAGLKKPMSAKSTKKEGGKSPMQTLNNQSLANEKAVNMGDTDIADITDEFGDLLENKVLDEVII